MSLCELVKFKTAGGVFRTGAYYRRDKPHGAIVHVHGSCGNFYEARFIPKLAEHATNAGLCFLTFNLRTRDCIAEGYSSDGSFDYVGGSVQPFNTCVDDIDAALNFLCKDVDAVVLNGHSLGCDRVVWYMLSDASQRNIVKALSLMSPCDSYALQEGFLEGETVDHQIGQLRKETHDWPEKLLSKGQYGVHHSEEEYFIPISRSALLSIIDGPPFKLFNIAKPADYRISTPGLALVGGADSLQMGPGEEMLSFLSRRFAQFESEIIPDAEHDFEGFESHVAKTIVE